MPLNVNQFAQTTVQGQLDLEFHGSVVSARVSNSQATALIAGQAVKADPASAGGVPAVLALAANTDTAFGFIVRNLKDASNPANARVEIALESSVMYMTAQTANPAIARFAAVEYDFATDTVRQWAGVNPIVGFAYDAATTAGDLIRVYVRPPAFTNQSGVKTLNVTATLAQINAGLVLIPGATGKKITVTNFVERVLGAFTTGTSVDLQSDATAVIVESTAEAGLTNGAVLVPASANVTLGAGFAAPLPTGEGLKVLNKGTASAGGTSITYTITYIQA